MDVPGGRGVLSALAIYLADLAAIPRLSGPAAAPVKYMTTGAVTALLAAPDPGTRLGLRDQFFMILMYDLAARDAEMLALSLADIDPRRLTADLLGKGSKPRRLPVTSETARHQRDGPAPGPLRRRLPSRPGPGGPAVLHDAPPPP